MDNGELEVLRTKLKCGEYDGADIMLARIAINELIELRAWQERAFIAHPNIDMDIDAICD